MKIKIVILCGFFLIPLSADAQTKNIDYQFRFLLHGQRLVQNGIGVAGWGIVPNTLNTKMPVGVALGGIVLKRDARWIEIMVGTFINGRTPDDPLLDVRASDISSKVVHLFGEVRYSLKTDTL